MQLFSFSFVSSIPFEVLLLACSLCVSAQNWTNSSSTDVDLVSNWSNTVTRSSATSSSFREVPLVFSIISLTVRPSRLTDGHFYSVDVLLNSTCPSRRHSNVTLLFQSSANQLCSNEQTAQGIIICDRLIFGARYVIDGYLLCQTQNVTLNKTEQLYHVAEPKYLNSTRSVTTIDSFFYLPGFFSQLIVQLTNINRTCSIEYSPTSSPFYHCLFRDLPTAQWFILNYYLLTTDQQNSAGDVTIVYTEVEDLNFRCRWTEKDREMQFDWKNLTALGYENLTFAIFKGNDQLLETFLCNPYASTSLCATRDFPFESGEIYSIVVKLRKRFQTFHDEKTERCSITTSLSLIASDFIRHEFVNETVVRLTWSFDRFRLQVRLRNIESNILIFPAGSTNRSALFIHLIEGSVYQVEMNLSKNSWPSSIQRMDSYIQTDLKRTSIDRIVRLSETSTFDSPSFPRCSSSNQFDNLLSGTIYNLSLIVFRSPLQQRFTWSNRTAFQLFYTNPSSLNLRSWRGAELACRVELLHSFSLHHSSECRSLETAEERMANCSILRCGCRYEYRLIFDRVYLQGLASTYPTDHLWNQFNVTRDEFQMPLESAGNLRLKSSSSVSKSIEVYYDRPSGCFDQLVLICEMISTNEQRVFVNANVCHDLPVGEFYRISVQTQREGWQSISSTFLQVHLQSTSELIVETNTNQHRLMSILVPSIVGIFVLLLLVFFLTLLVVYRQRRQQRSSSTDGELVQSTKINHILQQVNIYSTTIGSYLNRPVRIRDLPREYERLTADRYFHLNEEFNKLDENLPAALTYSSCEYRGKNRYKDIRPYDHSRVRLTTTDPSDSDYINANFISGLTHSRDYIACQAPLKSTLNDHWQMIWEQKVSMIVMLTNLVERGNSKCEQYWPSELDQAETFGSISVRVTSFVHHPAYDLRSMQLKKMDEIRSLKHYAFKLWNDHCVPSDGNALIEFIRLIRRESSRPMLVHCSAGVGRSGTFIALDRLFEQFDRSSSDDCLDVFGTVRDLRQCREKMVQNQQQYLFLYRCLKAEYEKISGQTNYGVVLADEAV